MQRVVVISSISNRDHLYSDDGGRFGAGLVQLLFLPSTSAAVAVMLSALCGRDRGFEIMMFFWKNQILCSDSTLMRCLVRQGPWSGCDKVVESRWI